MKDTADAERGNTVLPSFACGFNAMIREPSTTVCHDYCDSVPVLNRPFTEKGVGWTTCFATFFGSILRILRISLSNRDPNIATCTTWALVFVGNAKAFA